jgi:hypothetical protein
MLTCRATGERAAAKSNSRVASALQLSEALSGLQPLLDRLVDADPRPPFVHAVQVISHLLSLRSIFFHSTA